VVERTEGIDLDCYVEILTISQADPELTAQIAGRLDR